MLILRQIGKKLQIIHLKRGKKLYICNVIGGKKLQTYA